jgi:hypothetical protein
MTFVKTALTLAALLPAVSHATLGGTPTLNAITAGGSATPALRATAQVAPSTTPYTVHESLSADGVTVREYATQANVVFAVSWEGPVRPDMNALLGSYFPNFVAAGKQQTRGTGPLVERNGDLQIESIGHPGYFIGKAYVPRLIPAQVNPADLR